MLNSFPKKAKQPLPQPPQQILKTSPKPSEYSKLITKEVVRKPRGNLRSNTKKAGNTLGELWICVDSPVFLYCLLWLFFCVSLISLGVRCTVRGKYKMIQGKSGSNRGSWLGSHESRFRSEGGILQRRFGRIGCDSMERAAENSVLRVRRQPEVLGQICWHRDGGAGPGEKYSFTVLLGRRGTVSQHYLLFTIQCLEGHFRITFTFLALLCHEDVPGLSWLLLGFSFGLVRQQRSSLAQ